MADTEKLSVHGIRLRGGGGLNTDLSPLDIDPAECADGKNFTLHHRSKQLLERRAAFDLAGTAPNGEPVKGFAQVEKIDGTLSTLVQAGTDVYEWDGEDSFTSKGSVAAGARLRGTHQQVWELGTPNVIITDLAQVQPVMKWDGTNLSTIAHNLSGNFYARYCFVAGEAAWYANIKAGSATPHLIARSAIQDFENLNTSNQAGDQVVGDDDPFYLPAPDLRYINGFTNVFGLLVMSTRRGHLYKMAGSTAENFAIVEFYDGSGAVGDEPIAFIGNDFAYGRPGRLESLAATEKLGDVAVDDLSRDIHDLIKDLDAWNVYYLSRLQKVYFFSPSHSTLYVLDKEFRDAGIKKISPWSKWQTAHAMGFQPSAVMVMRDPRDGLENVFMGGSNGEIFRLEGVGGQDGGTTDITVDRLSQTFSLPKEREFDVSGYISYRKTGAGTLNISFEHGGFNIFDQSISITIESPSNFPVFGTGGPVTSYFGESGVYFGIEFEKRLTRQKIGAAGKASEFQIRLSYTGAADLYIEEIFVQFKAI